MQAAIDTLKTARSFETAGFAKAQAEALATAMADAMQSSREDLVTKDFLKAELAELRGEIAEMRGELRNEIVQSKNDMVRWLLGSQALLVVVLVALTNFTKAFG